MHKETAKGNNYTNSTTKEL